MDFHLSFYLGYVAAKHPDAQLVVVANDRGYDPMIAHARMLKFAVKRVGHKVASAKTPVAAKGLAPEKKAAAKTTQTNSAIAKKVPAKKAAAPKAAPIKASAQPQAIASALTRDDKTFARVKKALLKMGAERPTKLKSFCRHVGAMLGQGSTAEEIDAMAAKLEKAGVVRVQGDLVVYC